MVGVFAAIRAFAARLAYVLVVILAFQALLKFPGLHTVLAEGAQLVITVILASIEFVVFVFVPVVASGAHMEALIFVGIVGVAYVTVRRVTLAHVAGLRILATCAALEIALFDDAVVADEVVREGAIVTMTNKDSHPSHHDILVTFDAVGEQVAGHDRRFDNVLIRALERSFGHRARLVKIKMSRLWRLAF